VLWSAALINNNPSILSPERRCASGGSYFACLLSSSCDVYISFALILFKRDKVHACQLSLETTFVQKSLLFSSLQFLILAMPNRRSDMMILFFVP